MHTGLDLLAAVAAGSPSGTSSSGPKPGPLLFGPGPHNPAATISGKVAKRILDLEFVEISEVTLDDDIPSAPGRPPAPARPPVSDISQWVERFAVMAAIITSRFPDKAPELFAYMATIVRAERNYEGKQWVAYDRRYRREALARKDLNWSVPDPRLYNEAFTGRARAIPRCTYCLQDDHTVASCPRNPHRPVLNMPLDGAMWPPHPPTATGGGFESAEQCRRFNEGRCKKLACRYRHTCQLCGGGHPRVECAERSGRTPGRSRSPPRHNQPRPRGF